MLYIFLVDPGIMINFDMTYIVESVANLKKAIEEKWHIPASEQILLISGGERLEDTQRVGKYHTGTDSNPIFLFRDVSTSPPASVPDVNEYMPDLSESVNLVLDLPPTIQTVISRSALAQKLCQSAQEQLRVAEGLIHDQHLQQQGWSAVLAHLDDMIGYYTSVCSACERTYAQFLEIRDAFVDLLNNFNEDLDRISKLPVLPALLNSDDVEPSTSGLSLLDWISSHKDEDSDQTLAEVAAFCGRSIQVLDQKLMGKVTELREYIRIAESNYRDVKVIETKLEHLEQVLHASKRIVQDQISQAQTFNSNLTSAIKVHSDQSILKELCTFHREWLLVMESNRTQLCANLKTCAAYKSELCAYLQTRLQWVRKMFSDMRDTNEFVFLYYESIKKLRRHYDFLSSLRSTPSMYVSAVGEVVRRRAFSQAYLVWASDLSCQLLAITSEEVSRRKKFQEQFEGHFLDRLFPGLDEFPPSFATQAPESFDSSLPRLTFEDMDLLKQYLPELELSISIPEPTSFSHLFFFRSVQDTLTLTQPPTSGSVEDRIVQVVAAAGLASNLDTTLLRAADYLPNALCSDKGFDSEGTDTEEFEKLRHSGQTVSECSESNETVRTNIRQLGQDATSVLAEMRQELAGLKSEVLERKMSLMEEFQTNMAEVRRVLKERERTILHLTQILGMKESELCTLRSQVISVETNLKNVIEREETERAKREENEARSKEERAREMKDLAESLTRAHRAELETVRSRYKLITSNNMERSPSDTSLERIETNHEAMISQLRENFELEKENLLAEERKKWSEKLEHDLSQYKMKMEAEKQVWYNECMRQTLADHSQQLEVYRKREEALVTEVQRFESRLRQSSSGEDLLRRIQVLETEKADLEAELRLPVYSPSHPVETLSSSSVSIYEASASPVQRRGGDLLRERVGKVVSGGAGGGLKLSTSTCRPGDIVLILWNERRGFFYVFSATDHLYLLHPDCIPVSLSETLLRKYGFVAEVRSSEHCRAKKENNRYKVPVDSRFYRVEVGPISNDTLLKFKTSLRES